MWEEQIGEIIRNRREKLNIRQAKLSEGICTVSMLSKIENGAVFPTRYKLTYLLERLGLDPEQYVILSSKKEKEFNDMVIIFNSCIKSDVSLASYMLKKVDSVADPVDVAQNQITGECRLRLEIKRGEKPLEVLKEESLDLIKNTKPTFSLDRIRDELLSKTELSILFDHAQILAALGEEERALKLLLDIKDFLGTKDMDGELIREDQESVLLKIVEMLMRLGRFAEAESYSDEFLEVVSKSNSTTNLAEILINRITIAINLGRPPKLIKQMVEKTREIIKMDRGSETVARFDEYIRRECGYAWVNTA
jgi:transcriptional regulator with XRE-family HTH domain